MTAVLLSVHVLAAIVLIGPVTVAASLFPRYARVAAHGAQDGADPHAAVPRALHRVSSGYAVAAVAVPVFGIATAAQLNVLGQGWLLVSIGLTAVAAAALVGFIVPGQRRVLRTLAAGPEPGGSVALDSALRRLGMTTGLFALTWTVVVVLMILRPGSTTGV